MVTRAAVHLAVLVGAATSSCSDVKRTVLYEDGTHRVVVEMRRRETLRHVHKDYRLLWSRAGGASMHLMGDGAGCWHYGPPRAERLEGGQLMVQLGATICALDRGGPARCSALSDFSCSPFSPAEREANCCSGVNAKVASCRCSAAKPDPSLVSAYRRVAERGTSLANRIAAATALADLGTRDAAGVIGRVLAAADSLWLRARLAKLTGDAARMAVLEARLQSASQCQREILARACVAPLAAKLRFASTDPRRPRWRRRVDAWLERCNL